MSNIGHLLRGGAWNREVRGLEKRPVPEGASPNHHRWLGQIREPREAKPPNPSQVAGLD